MVAQKIRDFAAKRTNNIEVQDEIVKELTEMVGEIVSYCTSGSACRSFRSVGDVEIFLVPASGLLSVRVNIKGIEKNWKCFKREFTAEMAEAQFLALFECHIGVFHGRYCS